MIEAFDRSTPKQPRNPHLMSVRNPNGTEYVDQLCKVVDGLPSAWPLTPMDIWELHHVDVHPSVDWVIGVCRLAYGGNAYAMDRACNMPSGTINKVRNNKFARYETLVRISIACKLSIPHYIRREYADDVV